MESRLSVWEEEGGALKEPLANNLVGTANQIEWAERIRIQVDNEFERVARTLEAAARNQSGQDQWATFEMLDILEDKRRAVMANTSAGYFIHDWQELRDQVRQMIMKDRRYQAIKGRS